MKPPASAGTRDQLLFFLKTRGAQTVAELAPRLDITPTAVRQHLVALEGDELVEYEEAPSGVGRPARTWRLSPAGERRFPDGYADLALEVLSGVREAFGNEGLERLVASRTKVQLERYREVMPPEDAPLSKRVAALARLRSREGYLAEWRKASDGSLHLIENHCPICAAATACQGLCAGELQLFQQLLGKDIHIERSEHILSGARRCTYRIREKE